MGKLAQDQVTLIQEEYTNQHILQGKTFRYRFQGDNHNTATWQCEKGNPTTFSTGNLHYGILVGLISDRQ